MKITIGTPSFGVGGFEPQTVDCLMKLVARGGYDFHIVIGEYGYDIADNRNYITVQALNNKSDYLLMIDTDMTFESETLDKLLANNREICGVAYHSKPGPRVKEGDIMAKAEIAKGEFINLQNNTDPKYKKTFECYAVGTGIILIKCDIFYKIPRPWFFFTWFETGQCENGEDWNFCLKAKEAGYKIYCDPTIKVGHIGEKII